MKKTLLIYWFIGLACQISLAQDFDKNKLDQYFGALEAGNKFMGSVAVSKNGVVIYSTSVGYADLENQSKANESSRYRIGSISKTFTAVLVLKAVEEQKLTLDKTIDAYFPGILHAGKITVGQLLQHRSGIHNFTDDADYLNWHTTPRTEPQLLDIIKKGGSDFEPDSKAAYSNSNYVLLTFILEKVFGKSYSELLQAYITGPFGLKNTYLGSQIDPAKQESKSYRFMGTWQPEPETDMSIPLGAGALVSTPTDLVRFAEALFAGKLLNPESLDWMKSARDGFGMGLFPMPFYDKTGYGHTGGIDGFRSVFSYFPEENIAYALTSNGSNFNNNNISIAVLSAVYNKPYDIPVFSDYVVDAKELDSLLGIYASGQIPLKITITKDSSTLVAQATGQPAFPLEATGKNIFRFDQAGLVLEFDPDKKTMLLKQGGATFTFTKE